MPRRVRVAAQGPGFRHRAQSPVAARGHPAGGDPARADGAGRHGRGPHRGHAARGAAGVRDEALGHPHHHPGVAVSGADLGGPRRPGRGADRDPRRDPCRRGDQARRPPGGVPRAARRAPARPRATHRALGDRAPGRGRRRLPRGRAVAGRWRAAGRRRAATVDEADRGRRRRARPGPVRPGRGAQRSDRRRPAAAACRPGRPVGAGRRVRPAAVDLAARRGARRRPRGRAPVDPGVHQLAARRRAPDRPHERGLGDAAGRGRARPGLAAPGRGPRPVRDGRGDRHVRRGADPRAGAPRLDEPRRADPHRDRAQGGPAARGRRDVVARARHRHGRDRPRGAGGCAAVRGERAAAGRPRRSPGGCGVARGHLPDVPRRPGAVGGGRGPHAPGRDRAPHGRGEPARRARAADRGHDRGRGLDRRRPRRGAAAVGPVHRSGRRDPHRGPRHARGPLPERGVRRASRPDRLGPHDRRTHGPTWRAAARGHERGHHPRPRPVRRVPRLGRLARARRG